MMIIPLKRVDYEATSCNIFVMISNFVIWWHENQYLFSSQARRHYGAFKDVRFNKVSKRHSSSVFLCDFQHVAIFKPAGFGKIAMMTCTPFEMWNYIFFEALLARPAPVSLPNILSSCRKFDDRRFFRIEESPATKPSGKLLESSKKVSFSKNKDLKFAVLQHFAWTFGSLFCCSRSQPPSHIFSSTAYTCHCYWVGSKDIDILKLHMLGNSLWPFLGWLQ